ncbi:interleukin-2 receptor subunit beta [Suncus etruscus]|uniref:interleukin-2 receptor subunit beta n=1 Tax=Suncus etruscus TaxID=109475 RepID=UPI0021104B93|nr:interleukin-2 receptor subunit beta [Suncus etruscus]
MDPPVCWRLSLLFLLLLPVVTAQAATETPEALSCFYNSRANMTCVWSPAAGLGASNCRLAAKPKLSFIFSSNPDAQTLTAADKLLMSVECLEQGNWTMVMSQNFIPFDHIRLFAPNSLHVTLREPPLCSNITWGLPYYSHYFQGCLEFQVQSRTPKQKWELYQLSLCPRTAGGPPGAVSQGHPLMILKQNQAWICLENLVPDTSYELQVRARPQRGQHSVWSPWSETLIFRTLPDVSCLQSGNSASARPTQPFTWVYTLISSIMGTLSFVILAYFLVANGRIGSWLKKIVKCHIPDPSEYFAQFSSEHGEDFQKWLSSPFPSSAFGPSGPATEISPLEVLDRDSKATKLLWRQQGKDPASPSPSGHSLSSCFTNQGYFFFHLPDTLEIEACQVYFTYDPCEEEPSEEELGTPEVPGTPLFLAPSTLPGADYCTFPPGDDMLLFPGLPGVPAPLSTVSRDCVDDTPYPREHPSSGVPGTVQLALDPNLGDVGGDVTTGLRSEERTCLPWASVPGSGQVKPPISCLPLNPDAYLSLQELQNQEPVYSV